MFPEVTQQLCHLYGDLRVLLALGLNTWICAGARSRSDTRYVCSRSTAAGRSRSHGGQRASPASYEYDRPPSRVPGGQRQLSALLVQSGEVPTRPTSAGRSPMSQAAGLSRLGEES